MSTEIIDGMSDVEYHQLPSLSSSGAKLLLQEGGPAKYLHRLTHPPEPTAAFDLGHVVHGLVLGVGAEPVEVMADSFRTKAVSEQAAKIRETGGIPLLTKDFQRCRDMADAVFNHPIAARLLNKGTPEQSITWTDEETGLDLRCRPDWLRFGVCVDLKTAADASPHGFASAAAKYGYDLQSEFYRDGIGQATGDEVAFCFVVVEKEPPHMVGVYELDYDATRIGYEKYRAAVHLAARCLETGAWPAYGDDIQTISLPKWALNEWGNR